MPLIKDGQEIENEWAYAEGEVALPQGPTTVDLHRFLTESDALLKGNRPVGVRLQPDDDPTTLEPFLDKIALIEISFPKYTDGRGYSQAQLLRRRYGYTGEIRAVGEVLRDQILYMNRSGIDAYQTSRAHLSSVLEALGEFQQSYQPDADDLEPVYRKRH